MIKFQQSQALTSYFESLSSIVCLRALFCLDSDMMRRPTKRCRQITAHVITRSLTILNFRDTHIEGGR